MKNYNKICRHETISAEYIHVHSSNHIQYDPKRRGGVLNQFFTEYGVNKKEYEDFNDHDYRGINKSRCFFDTSVCYDER